MLSQPTARPPIARIQWADVAAASVATWGLSLVFVELGCWGPVWSTHCVLTLKVIMNIVAGWFQADATRYLFGINQDWLRQVKFAAAMSLPLGAAAWVGVSLATPRSPEIHVRGRQVRTGAEGAAKAIAVQNPQGILLHPDIRISHDQETKHFLVSGGTGAGKTIVVSHILREAIARDDRVLVLDYKGLTERMPRDSVIVAPTDARSRAWAISRDVLTPFAASEVAARLIPESGERFWSDGARAILTCIMSQLVIERGEGKWGFKDLADQLSLSAEAILPLAEKYWPPAISFVRNAESNTTDSLMKSLAAICTPIFILGEAWGNRQEWSACDWIKHNHKTDRRVILKIDDNFAALSAAVNQSILSVVVSQLSSLPDVPETHNPAWIIADEFPRLGKIEGWGQMLAVARSKSIRIVTVVQSISQIREIFGEHTTDTWTSIVGTTIIGKNEGASAEWACRLVGEKEVWTPTQTVSGTTVSNGFTRERLPVLLPSQIGTELGVNKPKKIVRMLALGLGDNAHMIDWPFIQIPDNAPTGHIPAAWTQPAAQTIGLHGQSAPDVAQGRSAGADSGPGISMPAQKEQAPAEQPAQHEKVEIDVTDDLPLLLPEPTKTTEIDNGTDPFSALEDAAKDQLVETVTEAIDVSPDGLSSLLKIAETIEDATGICQAETFMIVASKKKSRRRKSAKSDMEIAS